jgi:hypothetical protein
MVDCRNCGNQLDETIDFCPHCGEALNAPTPIVPNYSQHSSGLLTIAGIIIFFTGLFYLLNILFRFHYLWRNLFYTLNFIFMLIILIGFLGFFAGLLAAINIFQRKNYDTALYFSILLVICGLLNIVIRHPDLLLIILSLLGLLFLYMGRGGFNRERLPVSVPSY